MRLRLALHYTGQMFLRLGLATVIVVGNTLIMKEQITLFSYLLFLSAASRLYDPLSGAMVNMAELFAVDLQVKRLKGIQDFSVVFQNVVLFNNTIMENIRVGRKMQRTRKLSLLRKPHGVTNSLSVCRRDIRP